MDLADPLENSLWLDAVYFTLRRLRQPREDAENWRCGSHDMTSGFLSATGT